MIRELAGIGCTDEEIARVMGVSSDTLARRYRDLIDTGRHGDFLVSLRRLQWQRAKEGSDQMLKWLGINSPLGQRNEPKQDVQDAATIAGAIRDALRGMDATTLGGVD
jgi:AraC-like DNA-binding protein